MAREEGMAMWWWKRKPVLDAAGRRAVRSALGDIDYQFKQIVWDVARVRSAESAQAAKAHQD